MNHILGTMWILISVIIITLLVTELRSQKLGRVSVRGNNVNPTLDMMWILLSVIIYALLVTELIMRI